MMKRMICMLLALLLIAGLSWAMPVSAADTDEPVIYSAAGNAQFSRTKQEVAARYRMTLDAGPAYEDGNEQTYYDRMYSRTAPYDQGELKQDTLDAMMAMVNYLRWLSGTQPLPAISNDDELQRGALIRSFTFSHEVSHDSPRKPADMDQAFWNAGCDVYNNILAGGYTPRGSILAWCNEGYYHSQTTGFITSGRIGHRMAIIGSNRASLHLGYAGKIGIGYYGLGGADWEGAFAAYPAPGAMPTELVNAGSSAWSVEPNKKQLSIPDVSKLVVSVTDLSTGESYLCKSADKTLYVDQNAIAFMQPLQENEHSNRYADGESYRVVISGLTDVKTGRPAEIRYDVSFFCATDYPDNDSLFDDVDPDAYYYDAVRWAAEHNITAGTSEHTFSPNATCTRAQIVTFLWRASGSPEPTRSNNPFCDVDSGAYYYKAVLWAVEHCITVGTSATTFSPNQPCTRGQAVTFLFRAYTQSGGDANTPFQYTDVQETDYCYAAVHWAFVNHITAGTSATTFSPNAPCTRAQIVTLLYRCNGG